MSASQTTVSHYYLSITLGGAWTELTSTKLLDCITGQESRAILEQLNICDVRQVSLALGIEREEDDTSAGTHAGLP